MNFGNAWLTQAVKIFILSSTLLLTACSTHPAKQMNDMLDRQTNEEYKAYENKIGYCLDATHRKIESINDTYFNSLNDQQKLKLLSILSTIALDKCYSYEQARYYEYAIINNDKEAIKIIKNLVYTPIETEKSKQILESLDAKEIERLSNSEMFSTPFDAIYIRENLKIWL
jgi:outer membrane PBP1 activator LpoA protein